MWFDSKLLPTKIRWEWVVTLESRKWHSILSSCSKGSQEPMRAEALIWSWPSVRSKSRRTCQGGTNGHCSSLIYVPTPCQQIFPLLLPAWLLTVCFLGTSMWHRWVCIVFLFGWDHNLNACVHVCKGRKQQKLKMRISFKAKEPIALFFNMHSTADQ
jgi:hypothetical protein